MKKDKKKTPPSYKFENAIDKLVESGGVKLVYHIAHVF